MSVLCAMFGHRSRGPGYARMPHTDVWTDGTGRGHVHLHAECDRCGKDFHVISFHPPQDWIATKNKMFWPSLLSAPAPTEAAQPDTASREAREETTLDEVIHQIREGTFYEDYDWASGPALRALDRVEGLRPEVLAFAHLMEAQLRANDHKPGWKSDDASALVDRCEQEWRELAEAVMFHTYSRAHEATFAGTATEEAYHTKMATANVGIGREAADVANFAMMIADVCGALEPAILAALRRTPDPVPVAGEVRDLNDRFWLIIREPGCVPDRKGPWKHREAANILREFMEANPTAFIDYLTIGDDGTPDVEHGPQVLQYTDGRSMSVGRRHNKRVLAALSTSSVQPEREGFVLVPRESTEAMIEAAMQTIGMKAVNASLHRAAARGECFTESDFDPPPLYQAWHAMLAASPLPSDQGEE